MASPPNFLYMTGTLEVDKNLFRKLQMSKYSQTSRTHEHEQPLNEVCDLISECRNVTFDMLTN